MSNKENNSNVFGASSPILFVICALTFALIGVLVFRNYGDDSWFCRTDWFWLRVIWFELIFAVFWFAIFGAPLTQLLKNREMTGATYVIVSSVCLRASLISFAAWCISAFIPIETHWAKLPIVVQVVVALYYGIIVYMLPKTQILQKDGMERFTESVPKPEELANLLKNFERRCADSGMDVRVVKRIREKIQFSLPSVGKITKSKAYIELGKCISQTSNAVIQDGIQNLHEIEMMVINVIDECKNRS